MGYAELKREELPGLLTEIGVDETVSQEFCRKYDARDMKCLLDTSRKVRDDLLKKVHDEEKRINRLDFLIWHLQKEYTR